MWGDDTLFESQIRDFEAVEKDENKNVDENIDTQQMIDIVVQAYQKVGIGTTSGSGDGIIQDMIGSYWGERSDYIVQEDGIFSEDAGELVSWENEKEFIASNCSEEDIRKLYDLALDRLATVGSKSDQLYDYPYDIERQDAERRDGKSENKNVDEQDVKEQKEISVGFDIHGNEITKGDEVSTSDVNPIQGIVNAIWDDGSVDIEYTHGPGGPLADTFDIKGHGVQKLDVEESKTNEAELEEGLEKHVQQILDDAGVDRRGWDWSGGRDASVIVVADRRAAERIMQVLDDSGEIGPTSYDEETQRVSFGEFKSESKTNEDIKSDLLDIANTRLGWAVAEQLKSILDNPTIGGIEDAELNPNAVRLIYRFLKDRSEEEAKEAVIAIIDWVEEGYGDPDVLESKTTEEVDEEVKTFVCDGCGETLPLSKLSLSKGNKNYCPKCRGKAGVKTTEEVEEEHTTKDTVSHDPSFERTVEEFAKLEKDPNKNVDEEEVKEEEVNEDARKDVEDLFGRDDWRLRDEHPSATGVHYEFEKAGVVVKVFVEYETPQPDPIDKE